MLDPSLENGFKYLGRVKPTRVSNKPLKEAEVNETIKGYAIESWPDLFKDGRLISEYGVSAKYPLAEYTSMKRYANPYILPIDEPWNYATMMVAEAFSCMQDSSMLNLNDAFHWLERQTSPGYPWTLQHMTKAPILDDEWFIDWYKKWESDIDLKQADPFFWKAFIKDEVKKLVDLKAHNPRTILASPMHATILAFRLYGHMNGKLTTAGSILETPCCVGITKFNRSWDRLARHIMHFPNMFDGDCTRYDGTMQPKIFEMIRDFRRSCMNFNPGYKNHYYYYNVVNSLIVGCLGDLYFKSMGQPSGQGNTLHDNSIGHTSYWFYHWCLIACVAKPDLFSPTWSSFSKHVRLVVMGDDVIWSCSDVSLPYMNPRSVKDTFKSIGVTLKTSFDDAQPIDKLEFCSMHFHNYKGVYVPVMKRKKMLASIFLKKTSHPRVYLRRLLGLRIECWWDEYLRDIIENLIQYIERERKHELMTRITNMDGDDATYEQIKALHWPVLVVENHYLKAFD